MTDSITFLTRSIQVLRSRLAQSTESTGSAQRATRANRPTALPQRQSNLRLSQGSPLTALASRLAALNSSQPVRKKMALRLFIEAVLLEEFGSQLISATDFQQLVDRVVNSIDEDPAFATLVVEAIDELLPKPAI
jgi:hypothetical protein